MSYDHCNHECDEEGICLGCGADVYPERRKAYYEREAQRINDEKSGYALFDIDGYGEFVDEIWLNDGPLTDRDYRIMELGLPGEVGEVLELLKKHVRDGVLDRQQLKKELGDVAYYWARICTAYGFRPSEVILGNVQKLEGRLQRNTLRGSGNDR